MLLDDYMKIINNRGRAIPLRSLPEQNAPSLLTILPEQITKVTAEAIKPSKIHACAPRRSDSLTDSGRI